MIRFFTFFNPWRCIRELEAWKASVMATERQWNPNEIATMLGSTPGESPQAVIQREVPQLLARVQRLEAQLAARQVVELPYMLPDFGVPYKVCNPRYLAYIKGHFDSWQAARRYVAKIQGGCPSN